MASILEKITKVQNIKEYKQQHWTGTFEQYLDLLKDRPQLFRNAHQYLLDMILSYGSEEYTAYREKLLHYHFFDDPFEDGHQAIFGLDRALMDLVSVLDAGAKGLGTERRILLLHGPVGTAKSTILGLLKKGLEYFSRTDEGALYTFRWLSPELDKATFDCPMHEEPLRLIPHEMRPIVQSELGLKNPIVGDLCPACQYYFDEFMKQEEGDWTAIIPNIEVYRLLMSEKRRVGIGTFQPRDEKNQDSTELTGDINYRLLAQYGRDSDPRCFNFDGELNISNRGLLEMIEILKLDVAFLYDLLTATQEKKIKPKKFSHTDIDEVIIGHTNNAEYAKLISNDCMAAFCDRTIRVDIPYNLRLQDEIKIYERDYSPDKVKGRHIAPHTLQVAAMWAILTRLEEAKGGMDIIQKMKLYDGQSVPGYTEDSVLEMRDAHPLEGTNGISPRYIQDSLANVLVSPENQGCANTFLLLRELEQGLDTHSLIHDEKLRKLYRELLIKVQGELDEILKNEIQRAIACDDETISRLCTNYIDNVAAYINKKKVRNPVTKKDESPNEQLMRSIEEKIEIGESRKDDFRREIMNFIASRALAGEKFDWQSNDRLRRALELKLFEDQKDSIKLSALVTDMVDEETQKKIEVVKARMKDQLGYCDVCATDVLSYVSSIFARGDKK